MLKSLTRTRRNWALGLFGLLVLWFSWRIREVLNPLLLGYLLAFIVHPAVVRLEARGWSRRRAANVIFAVTGLVGGAVGLALVVQGTNMARRLADTPILEQLGKTGDAFLETIRDWVPEEVVEDVAEELAGEAAEEDARETREAGQTGAGNEPGAPPGGDDVAASIDEAPAGAAMTDEQVAAAFEDASLIEVLQGIWRQLSTEQVAGAGSMALRGAGGLWASLRHWFGSAVGLAFLLVLLPVYSYFLLFELGRIHAFVARYIPIRHRAQVVGIGRQIGEVISSFFRGRLLVCFLKGAVITIGLTVIDTDYALLLGMGSGLLALVPFVGPFGGFVAALVVGMTEPGVALLGLTLKTGVVYGVAEVLEGYYLVPKILGDSLGLHPVVVLVAVFAGGATLGMFGFLIALPLTATLVILVRELVLPALAEFADEDEITEEAGPGDGGAAAQVSPEG